MGQHTKAWPEVKETFLVEMKDGFVFIIEAEPVGCSPRFSFAVAIAAQSIYSITRRTWVKRKDNNYDKPTPAQTLINGLPRITLGDLIDRKYFIWDAGRNAHTHTLGYENAVRAFLLESKPYKL